MGAVRVIDLEEDQRRARAAATRPPTAAPAVSAVAPGSSVARMLQLQRSAGNRATVGSSVPTVIRRNPTATEYDAKDGVEGTSNFLDSMSNQLSTFDSLGAVQGGEWLQGNANTPTTEGAMVGSGISEITSVYGLGKSAVQTHQARKRYAEEKAAGRHKEASGRNASRDLKSGVGGIVTSTGNIGSQAVGFAGNLAQAVGNSGVTNAFTGASNLLGGIGGAIALPFTLLSTLRTARKTAKQYNRFRKLRDKVESPETNEKDAKKAWEQKGEQLTAAQAVRDGAKADALVAAQLLRNARRRGAAPEQLQSLQDDADAKAQLHRAAEDLVTRVEAEHQAAERHKVAMADLLRAKQERAQQGIETADDIRAYAMVKNQSGFIKKLIGTIGGFIGIGGGIAATLAAFAFVGAGVVGVSAAMATPFGWALCGAAAVIALAGGIYAFAKWANKRYAQLQKDNPAEPRWKSRLKSMMPWVKVERESHRDHMAQRLFGLALRQDGEGTKAREVLADLGLDSAQMGIDASPEVPDATTPGLMVKNPDQRIRDETVKLIAAKMAS